MAVCLQILLATYNSREYLRDQMDSLFAQNCQDFQLLIRDGGSQDNTLEIIREYQKKYPGRIRFLGSQKASALENFSALLKASEAELIMFCDHDDVWLPQKISHTLAKYREMEAVCGASTPMMVFTDSYVTDRNLKIISPSLFRFQHLNPTRLSLNHLILQNIPWGNTMLVNRALSELASPIPREAVMHDHWLSLTAAAFGKIGFLDESTFYYRQHSSNVYGAFSYSLPNMIKKIRSGLKKIRTRFEQNIIQAAAFGRRYGVRLSPEDREMLAALENWRQYGFWQKRKILLKYRILKSGFIRNIGMFIFL